MDDPEYSCLASEAIAYLSAHAVPNPRSTIIDALTTGEIHASGYFTHTVDGALKSVWESHRDKIPVQFWQAGADIVSRMFGPDMDADDDWTDDWQNDFFSNTHLEVGEFSTTKYFQSASNVRIPYHELDRLIPTAEAPQSGLAETTSGPKRSDKGGKPASKHGDVIASLTLRLADLPEVEFARYTTEALAHELAVAYRELGQAAPSEANCQKYAAGILRVLRARQT